MASAWLREIQDSTPAFGTGMTFYFRCLAFYLTKILGFTDFAEGAGWSGILSSVKNGTNGEFNLTGTDKQFRDTVANSFVADDTNRWMVVVDPVRRNAGIYKITYVSSSVVDLDFRSGATEYPTQTTGLEWYIITPVETVATGSITCHDAASIVDGEFVKIEDGIHFNNSKVLVIRGTDPGTYTFRQWRGAIVAGANFNPLNSLSGKKLYIDLAGSAGQMTFTGTNPLSIDDAVSQINTYMSPQGPVAYRSDDKGFPTSTGLRISFAQQQFGAHGQPDTSADNNTVTLTYSLSSGWEDLGLTGTGDLSAPTISQSNGTFQNTALPDPPGPATAADISAWMEGQIDAATGLSVDAMDTGGGVTLANLWPGTHGNRTILQSNYTVSGMSGGTGLTMQGGWFSCKSPSSRGWAIRVSLDELGSTTRVVWRVEVSVNGTWDAGAKIVGPVYIGAAVSNTMWMYAEGDDEGHWFNLLFHQSSLDYHLGCFVSELDASDSERIDEETVALHGIFSTNADYHTNRTSCYRNDDDNYWGRGKRWDNVLTPGPVSIYMMELSYANYDYGLTQWTSRERNARLTNALGYDVQDAIYGTGVICDWSNSEDRYEIVGILQGHYSCRANLTARTALGTTTAQNSLFHWFDGWAVSWPEITPQH